MTEPTTHRGWRTVDTATVEEPGARGGLSIEDNVVERIATHTASLVDGVVQTGSGLGKLVGRRLPKASSDVHGNRVRITLDIAVRWPSSAADVARAVRHDVSEAVGRLAGMQVLGVDVSVSRIERAARSTVRRVQ